ncbi:hypothetical protein [Bacillus mojavensis]
MDKDTKELADLLKAEHERVYNHLCKKLGKDVVDDLNRRMEIELSKRIKEQFNNFAE